MSVLIYREFPFSSPSKWPGIVAFIKANAQAVWDRGHTLRVIVTEDEAKRNREQNKFYFGVVIKAITEQVWANGEQFSKLAWHEWYARKFGTFDEITLPDGEIVQRRRSTSEYGVGEFSAYTNAVMADAAVNYGVEFE